MGVSALITRGSRNTITYNYIDLTHVPCLVQLFAPMVSLAQRVVRSTRASCLFSSLTWRDDIQPHEPCGPLQSAEANPGEPSGDNQLPHRSSILLKRPMPPRTCRTDLSVLKPPPSGRLSV